MSTDINVKVDLGGLLAQNRAQTAANRFAFLEGQEDKRLAAAAAAANAARQEETGNDGAGRPLYWGNMRNGQFQEELAATSRSGYDNLVVYITWTGGTPGSTTGGVARYPSVELFQNWDTDFTTEKSIFWGTAGIQYLISGFGLGPSDNATYAWIWNWPRPFDPQGNLRPSEQVEKIENDLISAIKKKAKPEWTLPDQGIFFYPDFLIPFYESTVLDTPHLDLLAGGFSDPGATTTGILSYGSLTGRLTSIPFTVVYGQPALRIPITWPRVSTRPT